MKEIVLTRSQILEMARIETETVDPNSRWVFLDHVEPAYWARLPLDPEEDCLDA
jgi:hypothetical protein